MATARTLYYDVPAGAHAGSITFDVRAYDDYGEVCHEVDDNGGAGYQVNLK